MRLDLRWHELAVPKGAGPPEPLQKGQILHPIKVISRGAQLRQGFSSPLSWCSCGIAFTPCIQGKLVMATLLFMVKLVVCCHIHAVTACINQKPGAARDPNLNIHCTPAALPPPCSTLHVIASLFDVSNVYTHHYAEAPLMGFIFAAMSQGNTSRLGKESRAATRNPQGSASLPASAPPDSEAGSGAESDSAGNEDDQAYLTKAEGVSARRTRQASAHLDSVWQELEATPPKHKSRRKASYSLLGHQISSAACCTPTHCAL